MSERDAHNGNRSRNGRSLARNAYINFVGQGAPIVVALFSIPLLIKLLGTERFGVLALAWVVMGYFGLFDLGLGRATTKFVAEYRARNETEALPRLVWSSLVVHVLLGLLGGTILALLTPWLTHDILNIPTPLLRETEVSFYLLAVSVPLVVTTAALRGILEAIQRFDLVNWIKVPASIANYLGPLLILSLTDGLTAVVGFLICTRGIVLLAHLLLCMRAFPELSRGFGFELALVKPLLGFGGWLTVASFIGPSMVSIDRFMLGALGSLTAVTLYTTPYEIVTKLIIFPTSLLAVLFPAFSAMAVDRVHDMRRLYMRAIKYLLVLVAPVVGILLSLSYDLLSLWVAADFATESAPVAQWLAIGILVNVLSQVAVTVLQGVGRADITAKLLLVQLPLYAVSVWFLVGLLGATGVAIAWTLQVTLAAVMLFVAANRVLPAALGRSESHFSWFDVVVVAGFLLAFFGVGLTVSSVALILRVAAVAILLVLFVSWEWLIFLKPADRKAFVGGLQLRDAPVKGAAFANGAELTQRRSSR